MKKSFTLTLGFLLLNIVAAQANLDLAPPSFTVDQKPAVFIDITRAHHQITYDQRTRRTTVVSTLDFTVDEAGHPIFDLVNQPKSVTLDGVTSGATLYRTPDDTTRVRVVNNLVYPGNHQLVIVSNMTHKVAIRNAGVNNFFEIRDLKGRAFLEQYIPSNLEFDQYPMTFDLRFANFSNPNQTFMTNGKVTKISDEQYHVEFPAYYTASSPFFHTAKAGAYSKLRFDFPSISGRSIPVLVYKGFFTYSLNNFASKTRDVLEELERDYGAFGHDQVIVFASGLSGGMEHAGATQTTFGALDHELFHSYFAKGVMPANGNAGWIDEAYASWRDKGYPRLTSPGFTSSNMGAKSPYARATDKRAYSMGMRFMGYLDGKMAAAGGMKAFMRQWYAEKNHKVITVGEIQEAMEAFSGLDLRDDFDRYILGVYGNAGTGNKALDDEEALIQSMHFSKN